MKADWLYAATSLPAVLLYLTLGLSGFARWMRWMDRRSAKRVWR